MNNREEKMNTASVIAELRDTDLEISSRRAEIAKHRLRISELEDYRVILMQRAEARAAMHGLQSPFGTLPDGATIAVRDPLTYRHVETASLAAPPVGVVAGELTSKEREKERKRLRELTPQRRDYKKEYNRRKADERKRALEMYGTDDSSGRSNGASNERKERSDKGVSKRAGKGRHRKYMDQVTALFRDHRATPMISGEVIRMVGVSTKEDKQAIYQALYELKKLGVIRQERVGMPYSLGPA